MAAIKNHDYRSCPVNKGPFLKIAGIPIISSALCLYSGQKDNMELRVLEKSLEKC